MLVFSLLAGERDNNSNNSKKARKEKKATSSTFFIFFFSSSGSAVHSEYNANNTFATAIYFLLRYAHQCAHYIAMAARFFDFVAVVGCGCVCVCAKFVHKKFLLFILS